MDYLDLVRKLRRKCRVSGGDPATLQGVLGEEMLRLKDWINEALLQIALMQPDWMWMRAQAAFQTIAGQAEYTAAQTGALDVGRWDLNHARCHTTAAGLNDEMMLKPASFEQWRDTWQLGATRVARSRPIAICALPAGGLGLGPTPLAGYTVSVPYFVAPRQLSADGDIPAMPAAYHMAIVYRAMMFYGASEAAGEVYQEGEAEFRRMAARMMAREAYGFAVGEALA